MKEGDDDDLVVLLSKVETIGKLTEKDPAIAAVYRRESLWKFLCLAERRLKFSDESIAEPRDVLRIVPSDRLLDFEPGLLVEFNGAHDVRVQS